MTNIQACVLTIGMSPYLDDLLELLVREKVTTRLYVNSDDVCESLLQTVEGRPHGDLLELTHRPGKSIYAEWNDAVSHALDSGDHLLLLNDDIRINSCVITALHDALETNHEYALIGGHSGHGHVVCDGGDLVEITPHRGRRDITNWCVMTRPSMWVPVDERYRVWYGDDDMLHKLHTAGRKIGVLTGIGVWHETSTTLSRLPWVAGAIAEDQRLWAETH